jgi:hypothetical protein
MCSVNVVFENIMANGYDAHKEALDVILVPDSDDGIGNHTVRFIQGLTRATCVVTILTCAIHVLNTHPELVHHSLSAVPILESCVNILCNFHAVNPSHEYYEMLRLPSLFPF